MSLDARRIRNVGASEVAALFSLDWSDDEEAPRETRLQLWTRKKLGRQREELPRTPEANDRLLWGQVLEEGISRGIHLVTGWGIRPGYFIEHPRGIRMSATLDFVAETASVLFPGRQTEAALELKNVDRSVYRKWPEHEEPGVWELIRGEWEPCRRQPPLRMKLQPQAQMACSGLGAAVLGVLVGGNELHLVAFERHEGVIARLEAEVAAFWQSVDEDRPPPADYQLDLPAILALIGDAVPGKVVDLRDSVEVLDLAERYDAARTAEAAAKKVKDEVKGRLFEIAGNAERALMPDPFNLSMKSIPGGWTPGFERPPHRDFRLTRRKEKRSR